MFIKFELKKIDSLNISFQILEQSEKITNRINNRGIIIFSGTILDKMYRILSHEYPDIGDTGYYDIHIRGRDKSKDNEVSYRSFRTEIERDFFYEIVLLVFKEIAKDVN